VMGPFQHGWTRQDVESVMARGDPHELLHVPIVVSMDPPDCAWSEAICLALAQHPQATVRGNAVLGFGHLARTCGCLDLAVAIPVIEAALGDAHAYVRAHAEDAAADLLHFLGVEIARPAVNTANG